ncbi:MAG: glycosyltransferase, partial [Hyphomicrobiales bacterium]
VNAYLAPTTIRKSRAKRAMGLYVEEERFTLDPRIFCSSKRPDSSEKITIVMPVFNAFEVLWDALERVQHHTDVPWRLILVEDKSTDKRVRPALRKWAETASASGHEIALIENARNLGFIESVNLAFVKALQHTDHVVLLNSDALVPKNWASRLMHPIAKNARVASVTPLSNDAELATAPFMCKRYDLSDEIADRIDQMLAESVSSDSYVKNPTGVGFCMGINRKFLHKIPELDTDFGKGYGEEVDWCQKAAALGGVHVLQPSLFVEHRGGASFGTAQKQAAIAHNNQIISERYPQFDRAVQEFIALDPLRTVRVFTACVKLSASQSRVKVYIGHSLGGGAELYLAEEIQTLKSLGFGSIVLRVGGSSRWRIEVHTPEGHMLGDTEDESIIIRFISALENCDIIYSCAVGVADPANFPAFLTALVERHNSPLTFLIHDYFAISPSYCLLDSDGVYRKGSMATNFDPAHFTRDAKGAAISATKWRRNWFGVLQASTEVRCFSQSSAEIVAETFPRLTVPVHVKPHKVSKINKVARKRVPHRQSLGVLGDIGLQKGANCVKSLSYEISSSEFEKLIIVGRLDPRFTLAEDSLETGAYQRTEIASLAEQNSITAWLIPSIWPETFSYTTHEALSTGLPVFCFDLGAQGEAVRKAPNGWVLPLAWANEPHLILKEIKKALSNDSASRRFNSGSEEKWNRGSAA